jgi:hypothetical protein
MSLPVELLDIIFNFCYLGAVYDYIWDNPSLSDTLHKFPYSLAAVDPTWNAILLRHREYWTGLPRVVFNIDSTTPTHIDDAKTLLRYMLHQPDQHTYDQFHVAIVRRSKENPDDTAEKERVRNLMDLLTPKMSRFKSFLVDVHASSSLPSVTTYFNDLMTSSIVRFEYLCDIDDSDDAVSYEPYDYGYGFTMQYSRITSMVLDGYTFRRNIPWLRGHIMLRSLTISHLSHATTDRA